MSVGNWHKGAREITTAFQFILFYVALDAILIWLMIALFNTRWRVASR